MKRTAILLIMLLGTCSLCEAQKIETKKVFGGYRFSQEGKNLTLRYMSKIMKSNTEAMPYMSKARSGHALATIVSGTGGFLVGFSLGLTLSEGVRSWGILGAGAGIIALSIPLSNKAFKNAVKAVDIYNNSLKTTSYNRHKPQLRLVSDQYGLGLSLRF